MSKSSGSRGVSEQRPKDDPDRNFEEGAGAGALLILILVGCILIGIIIGAGIGS